MSQHENSCCPRCGSHFECKSGNITQCQCYGLILSGELKAYIADRYQDCLCRECLLKLNTGIGYFIEKYIFRH